MKLKKLVHKIFHSSKGISLTELILAMGLMAGVGAISFQNIKTQQGSQNHSERNLAIETTLKIVGDALKKKNVCDQLFVGKTYNDLANYTPTGNPNPSTLPINFDAIKVQVGKAGAVGDGVANNFVKDIELNIGGASGRVPLVLTLVFEKLVDGREVQTKRRLLTEVRIKPDSSIECTNYEAENIHEDSFNKICGITKSNDPNFTTTDCEFNLNELNKDLELKIKEYICKTLGASSLVSEKCNQINLQSSAGKNQFNTGNINENMVYLSGSGERSLFDSSTCSNYLQGYAVAGSKACGGLTFKNGKTGVDGGAVDGGDCSSKDNYSQSGANSASTSTTCNLEAFTSDGKGGCLGSSAPTSIAGICHKFASGTCSGKTAGSVERYADGTSCGTNKECKGGNCVVKGAKCNTLKYKLSSSNTAKGTNKCMMTAQESNGAGGCKDKTPIALSSAGICKKFKSGTCTGSTAGTVENYADGTSCGTNKECKSGSCVAKDTGGGNDVFCKDGLKEYSSLASCESGGYTCYEIIIRPDIPALCQEHSDHKNCKSFYCRDKKAANKVDCVGSFVADGTCPKSKSDCGFHKDIQGWRNGAATFRITTPASGGGKACSHKDGAKGTTRCGICSCFISGTQITMADGSYKNIEDIVVGDKLLGSNDKINTVLELKHNPHEGKKYSINDSPFFVTEGHPFLTTQGWKAFNPTLAMQINPTLIIGQLKVGDTLIKANGDKEIIREFDYTEFSSMVYNFELDGSKDYFADDFLVHNK